MRKDEADAIRVAKEQAWREKQERRQHERTARRALSASADSGDGSSVSSEASLAGASSSDESVAGGDTTSNSDADERTDESARTQLSRLRCEIDSMRRELYHIRRETAKQKEALRKLKGDEGDDAGDGTMETGAMHVPKRLKKREADVVAAQAIVRRFLSRRRIRFFDAQFGARYATPLVSSPR